MRRLVAVVAVALAGCAIGRQITQEEIAALRPGRTTMAEAQEAFGPPRITTRDHGKGTTTMAWTYGFAGPFGAGARGESLVLVFGADGVLVPVCKGTAQECAGLPSPIHTSTSGPTEARSKESAR